MSGAIVDGRLYNNVRFVDYPEEAECEIRYDEIRYEKGHWLYLYHGYLVAVKEVE